MSDESSDVICAEILALSKMNWNNTQFDGKYPITIQCARNVGHIMKYLDIEKDPPPRSIQLLYVTITIIALEEYVDRS